MVYVLLARGWTDSVGAAHAAGDLVNVDAVKLAQLEAGGVVATGDGEIGAGNDNGRGLPLRQPRPLSEL